MSGAEWFLAGWLANMLFVVGWMTCAEIRRARNEVTED